MKKILFFLVVTGLSCITVNGQLRIDNATFFISPGATVTVQGDVTSNVDIQGTGLLQLKGTTVTAQNIDMGGFTIPNLEIDNSTANINFTGNAIIGSSLLFTNGKAQLNNFNLRLSSTATISGSSSAKFIITNGTGQLVKNSLGPVTSPATFSFPVGYSATEFNPVLIANSGTADDIGVRCLQNVLTQGLTGTAVTDDFANNSWVVTEGTTNGSSLTLTSEWVAGDELSNFNRVKSGLARYNTGTDWDMPASNVLSASGSGPYSRSRSGITSTGVFAIADLEKVNAARLNLKIFLQGNYNSGTGWMSDLLRDDPATAGSVDPVITITQPYSAAVNARFTRVGVFDGTTSVNETVNPTVFNTTGNDAIVDWVYVSTLDPSTPSVKLQTRAALLQRDGDIVDLDGVSPVSMPIDGDGNYHFLVGHRNHLSVRTPSTKILADNTIFDYNFTTNQSQAFQITVSPPTNAAMKDLGGGVFGLWAGNANSSNNVRYGGSANDPGSILLYLGSSPLTILSNVYSPNDVNMDRRVRYGGGGNDPGAMLIFLGSNPLAIFTEHL